MPELVRVRSGGIKGESGFNCVLGEGKRHDWGARRPKGISS